MTRTDTPEYTVDELRAMPEEQFEKVVTDSLVETRNWNGSFQHPDVIHRTGAALVTALALTNIRIERRRTDPRFGPEDIDRIESFRAHLLAVVESTDRRIDHLSTSTSRTVRRWKDFAEELIEVVEDSHLAWALDEIDNPFGDTAREWIERRRIKEPSRKREEVDQWAA
ncbi:hypothetical protein [Agromyces larvae]|uniref:DUF4254 domain-containing protein n=1 Tax=Agromyces larvae TaxID=2929802 RepID=A0ABY4C357_9MICO|nr:hypothetical protein [Agromyces larvae]UOE45906.1 hypothetical protein MTO99_09245 [Agromyces larvae]